MIFFPSLILMQPSVCLLQAKFLSGWSFYQLLPHEATYYQLFLLALGSDASPSRGYLASLALLRISTNCDTRSNIHVTTLPTFVDKVQKFLCLACVVYVTCLNCTGNMVLVKFFFFLLQKQKLAQNFRHHYSKKIIKKTLLLT